MAKQQHWNEMYNLPAENIPWEIVEPPHELVSLVESGLLQRGGSALDIGCGTGNYSIYLARQGFQVTGIDLSAKAIAMATEKARESNVQVKFLNADIIKLDTLALGNQFDFILDYSILHHISDNDVAAYAAQTYKALKPGGLILLVCYTESNEYANGKSGMGKYGNSMYFRDAGKIRGIYCNFLEVSYARSTLGRRGQHEAHSFVFTKNK